MRAVRGLRDDERAEKKEKKIDYLRRGSILGAGQPEGGGGDPRTAVEPSPTAASRAAATCIPPAAGPATCSERTRPRLRRLVGNGRVTAGVSRCPPPLRAGYLPTEPTRWHDRDGSPKARQLCVCACVRVGIARTQGQPRRAGDKSTALSYVREALGFGDCPLRGATSTQRGCLCAWVCMGCVCACPVATAEPSQACCPAAGRGTRITAATTTDPVPTIRAYVSLYVVASISKPAVERPPAAGRVDGRGWGIYCARVCGYDAVEQREIIAYPHRVSAEGVCGTLRFDIALEQHAWDHRWPSPEAYQ